MDGASRRSVASWRAGPLRGLPSRPLGSNPRGLAPAGFQVGSSVLRLVAVGVDALRGRGLSAFGWKRFCVRLRLFRAGRWPSLEEESGESAQIAHVHVRARYDLRRED
jgi:hypothetical protein